ncbi:MAG: 50S ribosomal protein L9 [Candidatus Riflebacteria bacterium]|nr:50S ribosomal protein L9 [Candidatus Riflebacteria bacterium]
MEVLLIRNVDRVGTKGETKRVTEGYARNFLFPRSLAVPLTPGAISHLNLVKVSWERKAAKEKNAIEVLAQKINGLTVRITKKAGDKGRLFGSVTSSELSDMIKKESGIEIDKHQIIADHIKELGQHEVNVRFPHQAKAILKVVVVPEEAKA